MNVDFCVTKEYLVILKERNTLPVVIISCDVARVWNMHMKSVMHFVTAMTLDYLTLAP